VLRRLVILASVVVFVDVASFSAITPLLPGYVDDLGLGKAGAGVLTASYAAGTLLASLPAGALAARVGPRTALLAGLALLGSASLVFGLGESILVLDLARFAQGVGSALTWAGAITWLVVSAPYDRRGELIGTALAAAVGGALLGPVIGAVAEEVGTELIFGSVALLSIGLGLVAARLPEPDGGDRGGLNRALASMRSVPVTAAVALVAVPSVLLGLTAVLVPLRIDELGGSSVLVAVGFAAGAAVEVVLAPLVGRLSDRRGRRAPLAAGLVVSALAISVIPFGDAVAVVLGGLIGTAVGAGLSFAPAMAGLTDAAERVGMHQGYAAGLINMAWAAGQVTGSTGAGAGADAFGDAAPCFVVAVLLLGTAAAAMRWREPRSA